MAMGARESSQHPVRRGSGEEIRSIEPWVSEGVPERQMDHPVAVGLGQKLWEIVRGRETVTGREAQ